MEKPMLLALPARRSESNRDDGASELPLLHAIETGSSPQIESALLRELLHRSPGLLANLTDPAEVHSYAGAPAALNAYKQRLQAIRGEYINARIRAEELETQLKQAQYEIHCLQKHVAFLDGIIAHMRASRGWKLVEKCSELRRSIAARLGRIRGTAKAG